MAQTRTAAFAAQADADDNAPVLLVRVLMSGLTKYLTSRAGTYGGQAYEELLAEGLTLSLGMDRFGAVQQTVGDLVLANGKDVDSVRFSDLLGPYVIDNAEVQADMAFVGLGASDWLRVFKGVATLPEENAFDDREFRMVLLDEGQPARPEILALRANRIHKVLGTPITTTAYPRADPDVVGRMQPILYGALGGAHALAVDAGVVDALAADVTAAQTTLPLSDAGRFAILDISGTVQIEDEQITYTGKTVGSLTLTGCTRGASGTTAAAHVKGRPVWEIRATYIYLVAAHACKSVGNVVVDGVLQSSGYTVDLTGPTRILFSAKPKRALQVQVTVQPVHAGTTVAEQTPGAISTTAEQTPGSIATSAEQGVSTNTGSHSHGGEDKLHEFQSSPSIPGTFTADTTFDFANTPKSGFSADWHIKVSVISGTWKWRKGGVDIITLSVGDNFFTEASPGIQYVLFESAAGQITIDLVERDITRAAVIDAGAATGVLASLTGATATAMAALAGATATLMSALSGSTAVSVSRTVDVVVSAADIEVGEVVVCDVEGYRDDGAGTYTGTPNALITNPGDQLRHLLAVQLGLVLADYVDAASFTQARADFAAAGIRADWGLYEQMDSAELCERLRWSVAGRLFLSQDGKFRLSVLPVAGSIQKTITEKTDALDEAHGGHAARVGRTRLTDLINHVWLGYAREVVTGNYLSVVEVADAASQTTYRTDNGLKLENDFIRDATAAAAVANKYLAWHKDVRWRAVMTLPGMPNLHLELLDQLGLSIQRMPGGGWGNKPFRIEQIRRRILPAGGISTATLTLLEV
ncbi:MAG: hypothetical protein HY613_05335 [Candidatus Rokubacteria bacterium]|nr:hypothetical protein [Candidatus Rokubacteria bacterium]